MQKKGGKKVRRIQRTGPEKGKAAENPSISSQYSKDAEVIKPAQASHKSVLSHSAYMKLVVEMRPKATLPYKVKLVHSESLCRHQQLKQILTSWQGRNLHVMGSLCRKGFQQGPEDRPKEGRGS